MSGIEQVMAVLLEEEDLRLVHRDWPRKMRLAVCLMPSGDCQLLLFRQEETGIFAARLRKHLGLRPAELCIHPPVQGFPTRQLRYSDQRSLAALLADSPQLVEDATDYSVNFAFALEEGLDPVAFLGVEAESVLELSSAPMMDATPEIAGSLQFASRRAPAVAPKPKRTERKLTFDLAREAARVLEIEPKLQPGAAGLPGDAFKPISDFAESPVSNGYTLREEQGHFVISNGSGPLVQIENAGQLFLRDDRQLLAIRIELAGDGQPGTVRIKSGLLPAALTSALRAAIGTVDVTSEASFLYVTLPMAQAPEPLVADQPPASTKPTKSSMWRSNRRRSALRLLALTTVTASAIFFFLGMQPVGTLNQNAENGPIDWSQFRLSMQADQ